MSITHLRGKCVQGWTATSRKSSLKAALAECRDKLHPELKHHSKLVTCVCVGYRHLGEMSAQVLNEGLSAQVLPNLFGKSMREPPIGELSPNRHPIVAVTSLVLPLKSCVTTFHQSGGSLPRLPEDIDLSEARSTPGSIGVIGCASQSFTGEEANTFMSRITNMFEGSGVYIGGNFIKIPDDMLFASRDGEVKELRSSGMAGCLLYTPEVNSVELLSSAISWQFRFDTQGHGFMTQNVYDTNFAPTGTQQLPEVGAATDSTPVAVKDDDLAGVCGGEAVPVVGMQMFHVIPTSRNRSLRVFEPRYLRMIRYHMATGKPFIIASSYSDEGGGAFGIGTLCRVLAITHTQRLFIKVHGLRRVRLKREAVDVTDFGLLWHSFEYLRDEEVAEENLAVLLDTVSHLVQQLCASFSIDPPDLTQAANMEERSFMLAATVVGVLDTRAVEGQVLATTLYTTLNTERRLRVIAHIVCSALRDGGAVSATATAACAELEGHDGTNGRGK